MIDALCAQLSGKESIARSDCSFQLNSCGTSSVSTAATKLQVLLNTVATSIDYSDADAKGLVTVELARRDVGAKDTEEPAPPPPGRIRCRQVIHTASIGCLQRSVDGSGCGIRFHPPIRKHKAEAIRRLRMGQYMKVW